MADLYDKISVPAGKPKRRRDSLTVVLLLVGLGIICIAVILVYRWFHNDKLYDDYVSDLSRSTVTVNDTGYLFAKIDGVVRFETRHAGKKQVSVYAEAVGE